MSEKVRGALFNSLGDINGLRFLDTYSGSGALAYEAVSRGAKYVQSVEKSIRAYRTIKKNIASLDIEDDIKATRANISTWSDNNVDLFFDVVTCDPPYDNIRPDVIEKLIRHLNQDGIFVLSWPGSEELREFDGLEIIKNSDYGDSQLVFYRKTG